LALSAGSLPVAFQDSLQVRQQFQGFVTGNLAGLLIIATGEQLADGFAGYFK
jgi:type IV secretory pathway VirB2 component (pilin)